jgi:hypothetical protein
MPSWYIEYTPEVRRLQEERQREHERLGRVEDHIGHGPPSHVGYTVVEADELEVVSGALVFYRSGYVSEVIGPTVYLWCST